MIPDETPATSMLVVLVVTSAELSADQNTYHQSGYTGDTIDIVNSSLVAIRILISGIPHPHYAGLIARMSDIPHSRWPGKLPSGPTVTARHARLRQGTRLDPSTSTVCRIADTQSTCSSWMHDWSWIREAAERDGQWLADPQVTG
jgi:hypothetical protein